MLAAHRRLVDRCGTGRWRSLALANVLFAVLGIFVGGGKLDWRLREDQRVTVLERCNVRHLEPEQIGGPVPFGVADLSFISLLTVAPALVRCTTADAGLVLLVKPQFEAGRAHIGRGGVVRDPEVHRDVLARVADGLAAAGLPVVDAMASPLLGPQGNREFLFHVRRGARARDARSLAGVAAEAP